MAFVNSEHFVSVFFDLEKTYDRTWRYGIVRDMHNVYDLEVDYLYT